MASKVWHGSPELWHHARMHIARRGEFELIRKFAKLTPRSRWVPLGIGDDTAAVLPTSKGRLTLLTCDSLIEGIHFLPGTPPFQIGWKAMARNLSDIAAMGGIPRYALVAASLPPKLQESTALGIFKGLQAAAHTCNTIIVGGDTSRSPSGIHLTVTLVGEIPKKEMITRAGASVGDVVLVTGTLGASIHGKHLTFHPRLTEGRFLASRIHPTSMMDLSDGLASDLHRLAEQSHVGFEILGENLPFSPVLKQQKHPLHKAVQHAMQDGEDYELVFTLPQSRVDFLRKTWKKTFRTPLTCIGTVRPPAFGVQVHLAGKLENLSPKNDHFKKP